MKHFFDVGANIGQSFKDFLLPTTDFDGWTVWCFEPSPRHFARLIKTAELYKGRYRIILCPFGLGGETQPLPFYWKADARGDSFQQQFIVPNVNVGFEICSTMLEIGWFIRRATGPDDEIVLKLDCEGAEFDVLEALAKDIEALSRVSRCLVEWHAVGLGNPNKQDWAAWCNDLVRRYELLGHPIERWNF